MCDVCNGTGVIGIVGRLIRLCLECRPTTGVRVADPVTAFDGNKPFPRVNRKRAQRKRKTNGSLAVVRVMIGR